MRKIVTIASISGILCIAFGAFGAHALKPLLSLEMRATFETGVRYQFYHTLALLLVAVFYQISKNRNLLITSNFFYVGIVLFSGSLYLLALSSIVGETATWIGFITPFGGISFIIGWIYLLKSAKNLE
jgi:uncharacterized membrane protein YgdD (TMEM256/DUF423 family)